MITENPSNVTLEEQGTKLTYEQFGLKAAENAQGNSEQLKEVLPIIYNKIVEEAKLDKENIQKRIAALNEGIADAEEKVHNLGASKVSQEEEIQSIEKQIADIEQNKSGGEIIPFVIATFITILLTFYLWAFYSASGYASLNGIKEGKTNFAGIFAALGEAFNKGGFVVVLTVLFPIIFLGLGFLINDALDKKKYAMIVVLLLFTFLFDAIIGYQISRHIYINEFNAGETEIPWKGSYVFTDINFYLVIASGFVCYVMWGFLLNYTLTKQKEIQPDARIKKLKEKIMELKTAIQQGLAAVKTHENNIVKKKKAIHDYETGKVIINITRLKALIGEFVGGWVAWIYLMRKSEAESLVLRTTTLKDEWLARKIAELDEAE